MTTFNNLVPVSKVADLLVSKYLESTHIYRRIQELERTLGQPHQWFSGETPERKELVSLEKDFRELNTSTRTRAISILLGRIVSGEMLSAVFVGGKIRKDLPSDWIFRLSETDIDRGFCDLGRIFVGAGNGVVPPVAAPLPRKVPQRSEVLGPQEPQITSKNRGGRPRLYKWDKGTEEAIDFFSKNIPRYEHLSNNELISEIKKRIIHSVCTQDRSPEPHQAKKYAGEVYNKLLECGLWRAKEF